MPVDVICPKCHSKLRAPDEVVGKSVRCKKCQEKFLVPSTGGPVENVGETQMLSVVESPKPAESKPAAVKAVAAKVSVPADPFAFASAASESEERPKKKPKRDDKDEGEEDDRPRKKSRIREEPETVVEDERPRKKKEKPLIGGEPTFAMPGAAEESVTPPPVHAGQFAFGDSAPPADDEERDDRPKKKKKRVEDDERPRSRAKKPTKRNPLPFILGGVAAFLLLGCTGGAAAIYFFVFRVADAVSKATAPTEPASPQVSRAVPTAPGFPSPSEAVGKAEAPAKSSAMQQKRGMGGGATMAPGSAAPAGPALTAFILPPAGLPSGPIVAKGVLTPVPFSPDLVRQIQNFPHPTNGPAILAVYQSQLGFNGMGAEDTIVRFDPAKKLAGEFIIGADGISGPRLLDVSDSGERVALEGPPGRLTIYDFSTKTKVFDGFDLYAGLPEREGLAGIAFADASGHRVAVVDKLGAVDVWDVKERQRTVTGKPDPSKGPVAVQRRKSGATRGTIAGKGWMQTVDWNQGPVEATLKLPPNSGVPILVAGQDSQGHVALVHTPEGSNGRELLVVDKTGAAVWRVSLPAAAGQPRTLRWFGADQRLALGFDSGPGLLLLDFTNKVPYGYLKPGQEKTLLSDTGDLYLVPNPKMSGKGALVQATSPEPGAAELAKGGLPPERLFATPDGLSK